MSSLHKRAERLEPQFYYSEPERYQILVAWLMIGRAPAN
ncbi:hypothetical protein HCH_05603 [Hahella chejuensis KCTC 2396]|uniref:Uncharacterized protein n=1 Tax=Hahella chejuensis (strain KCTC 2396) TaxID=349521 RepID=Q2SAR2_HAHCH|nr:hypothetical protein HCH_05603 [Hahella chejuensis KCTC 2396]